MDHLKPEFLKKLTKFIVLLMWVLSLLTTHNFYLYRFTIQLVTHRVDKNYMFLLCNGLLVFVAKWSGLIVPSKPVEETSSNTDKTFDYQDFESYNALLEVEYSSVHGSETDSFLADEVTVNSLEECKVQETEENKEDYDDPFEENGREEERDILDGFVNEEEEDEKDVGLMNEKFDEFIRKMKEELRIEARRQLIVV